MTLGKTTQADQLINNFRQSWAYPPISDSQADTLYSREINRKRVELQSQFSKYLGVANSAQLMQDLAGSRELVALLDLAYNSPGLIGGNLTRALWNGNRAEAWFEIRYGSNGGASHGPGIAKRRYFEAELFGLYDNPNRPSRDEARAVYRMFQLHREAILKYEAEFGLTPEGVRGLNQDANLRTGLEAANADFDLSLLQGDLNGKVDNLMKALDPAKTALVADLRARHADLPATLDAILSTNIYIDPSVDANHAGILDARRYDANVEERVINNLVLGEGGNDLLQGGLGDDFLFGGNGNDELHGHDGNNVLYGEAGQDTLYGGKDRDIVHGGEGADNLQGFAGDDALYGDDGNDILIGGKGDDTLSGGAGFDTYLWNTGDGNDTILDEDGKGRLMVNDAQQSVAKHVKDDPDNVFKTEKGDILTLDATTHTLTIALNNGGGITVNNFDRSAKTLGIDLQDEVLAYNGAGENQTFLDYLAQLAQNAVDFVLPAAHAATNEVVYNPQSQNNALSGTSNNDLMIGRPADQVDTLFAGAGNDTLFADGQIDDLHAYLNTDSGQPQARDATFQNELSGETGEDLLVGGATADKLWGGTGADLLIGGEGADEISGDEGGSDRVTDGNDLSYACASADQVFASGSNDFLNGEDTNDIPLSTLGFIGWKEAA